MKTSNGFKSLLLGAVFPAVTQRPPRSDPTPFRRHWMKHALDLYNVFARTAADSTRQLTDIKARTYEEWSNSRSS